MDRQVEPQFLAKRGNGFRQGCLSEYGFAEIARQKFDRTEQDQGDYQQRDQAEAETLQNRADYRMHLVEHRSWIRSTLVYEPKIRPAVQERVFVVPDGSMPTSYLVGKIRDAAGPVIPDTSDEIWRTFLSVQDRLVSVSIINFTDAPMPDGLIFAQMEEIAKRIKALNN